MPKRRISSPKAPIGDPDDPDGLWLFYLRHLEWLKQKNYSQHTLSQRTLYLRFFLSWCEERSLRQPTEITKAILISYQRYLFLYRNKKGKALSFNSQAIRLVSLRVFFKWLSKYNYILYNPAADIELPKLPKRLPKNVLSKEEAEQVLGTPDTGAPLGLRDRAILETFYSTGIRRSELIGLNVYDIDESRGTLMVREGKGKRDRVVPIGTRALFWVNDYRQNIRLDYVTGVDEGVLFLSRLGEPLTGEYLTKLVGHYIKLSGINKSGACHLFRHTMATLMLENGADIRFIQEMLGHENVQTTQIYTRVSIKKLKDIHNNCHPGASLSLKEELNMKDNVDDFLASLGHEDEEAFER